MEQLDELALSIGQSSCAFLNSHGHDAVRNLLCSDGEYSAGWKLVVAGLVFLGVVLAWLGLGRRLR